MIPNWDPVLQALFASLFTWGVTALGAALVFVLPASSRVFLDSSLGFAGGVMTAASFWSLLAPAIEISENQMGKLAFVPVAVGFALGALFVHFSDCMIPSCVNAELTVISAISGECQGTNAPGVMNEMRIKKLGEDPAAQSLIEPISGTKFKVGNYLKLGTRNLSPSGDVNGLRHRSRMLRSERNCEENVEGGRHLQMDEGAEDANNTARSSELGSNPSASQLLSWRRILLLIMAVTVHNFPEGLAVGVAFGGVGKTPSATFEKAFNLAFGIGLQNFPEGLAVSLPLAGFGYSKWKAFLYGQMSGMVEPIAALLGASLVLMMEFALPYALSFAAGAMIYVVFDSIIPEAYSRGNGKMSSLFAILGFMGCVLALFLTDSILTLTFPIA
uniref:Zinc transporter ZIP11 n=1 Tax=Globodera rostochiensis TaxID=31243 RepID=A0A914H357_GLORO